MEAYEASETLCHHNATNSWLVWPKQQPTIARVMKVNKIKSKEFWLRQLLTQPRAAPRT